MSDKIKIGDLVEWTEKQCPRGSVSEKELGVVVDENHRYYFVRWSHRAEPLLATNKDYVQPARVSKKV